MDIKLGRLFLFSVLIIIVMSVALQKNSVCSENNEQNIVIPNIGDFLLYNFSRTDYAGYKDSTFINFTFREHPFGLEDVFNITVQCGDWQVFLGWGQPSPDNDPWVILNITSRVYQGTYPFNNTMAFPAFFPYMVPTNISIGSSILMGPVNHPFSLTVHSEENVTLYEVEYTCWNASGIAGGDWSAYSLFWKPSGIAIQGFSHAPSTAEAQEFVLIRAMLGEFIVIDEFPLFLILPLFMIATSMTLLIHRRKSNK